jgi:hypothetical protein
VVFQNSKSSDYITQLGDGENKVAILANAASNEVNEGTLTIARDLNPHRKCYFVQKPVAYECPLAVFNNVMGRTQLQLFGRFYESGLSVFWKRLARFQRNSFRSILKKRDENEFDLTEHQIQASNLTPVFSVGGIFLSGCALVLLLEMGVNRLMDKRNRQRN